MRFDADQAEIGRLRIVDQRTGLFEETRRIAAALHVRMRFHAANARDADRQIVQRALPPVKTGRGDETVALEAQ